MYKRQISASSTHGHADFRFIYNYDQNNYECGSNNWNYETKALNVNEPDNNCFLKKGYAGKPVSYTHLDVYKRQE